MKHLALSLFTAFLTCAAGAQGVTRYQENLDPTIARQADSLRNLFTSNGYILMKENAVNMESQFEFPVIVPLQAGINYQFVFIGEMSSRIYEVRMYDWSEKQVFYKKLMWGDVDGNIITYPYVARADEYHLMRVLQVNKQKKKDLSGYVMLFRRTHSQMELDEQAERMKGSNSSAPAKAPVAPAAALPTIDSTNKSDTAHKNNHYDQFLTGKKQD